jgi:hypothetical protein
LPRRKKKDAGIQFYDLAYSADGIENGFSFQSEIILHALSLGANAATPLNLKPLRDNLLAVPEADRKTHFHKIEKGQTLWERSVTWWYTPDGDVFGDDRLETSDKWTDKGLILSEDEGKSITKIDAANVMFSALVEFATAKITALPDRNAASVPFTPSNKMDVYLAPQVIQNWSYTYYNLAVRPTHSQDWLRFASYDILPRHLAADYLDAVDDPFDLYRVWYKTTQLLKQLPAALNYTQSDMSPAGWYHWLTLDPAAYPNSTIYTPTGVVSTAYDYDLGYGFNFYYFGSGFNMLRLQMMIFQNEQWFYFWNNSFNGGVDY